VWKKLNLTQQKHTFINQKNCTTTLNKHELKPGLVVFYYIWPGNGAGLFSKEKIRSDEISKEKVKKKVGKHTMTTSKQCICIYSAESRAHYAPEPTWGNFFYSCDK